MSLTGPDGLLTQLSKTVLVTSLNEEVTGHLGYEKPGPPGAGTDNVGNGTRSKTVLAEASGRVEIDVPRDRAGTFERQIVGKRQRRLRRSGRGDRCAQEHATLVPVDEHGKRLQLLVTEDHAAGHRQIMSWLEGFGAVTVAVEDCRHLMRRLEADLLLAGHRVVRVHTRLMAGCARSSRQPGKSGPIDAEAVARIALREDDLPTAELPGPMREVKLYFDHRRSLVAQRTALQAKVRWFPHEIDPELDVPSRGLHRYACSPSCTRPRRPCWRRGRDCTRPAHRHHRPDPGSGSFGVAAARGASSARGGSSSGAHEPEVTDELSRCSATAGVAAESAARGQGHAVSTSRVAVVVFALVCVPVLVVAVGVAGAVALPLAAVAAAVVRTEILRQRIPSVGETAAVARPDPQTDRNTSWAPPSAGPDPVTAASEVENSAGYTDEDLCWAWRRSFARLTQASGPNTVNHLARLRGHYLDELERRNPRGFAAWMDSGARAASDPAPFFLSVR